MAEITRKRNGQLVRTLFEILIKYPDGLKAKHAIELLAKSIKLTPYEEGFYDSSPTPVRRFDKIIRFATIDCVKGGWLVKSKGTWTITSEGIEAYNQYTDPETFANEAQKLYLAWHTSVTDTVSTSSASETSIKEESIEDSSSITFEQAQEQAWSEVEKYLKSLNPYDFQNLVADLLRGMGYFVSWVSPAGKDGGVDIIAHPDPLGTQSPRIKVQVKRYSDSRVDKQTVQSFISTINEGDAGLFVATSGFTKDAEEHARSQERRKVMLIDWKRLSDLWIQFQPKLDDAARQRFPITPIYFLTPRE